MKYALQVNKTQIKLTKDPPIQVKGKGHTKVKNIHNMCLMVIHPYAKISYAYVKEKRHLARLKFNVKV